MFLKNCWYVAAWDYELIDGKMLARTLLGENVLLYRGDSGEVIALQPLSASRRTPVRGTPRRRQRALHVSRYQI